MGTLTRYYWLKIGGAKVTDVTRSTRYPNSPNGYERAPAFEGPSNWATKYGDRYVGYLVPPVTGYNTFWVASDDTSELRLSTNSDSANATLIAYASERTRPYEWTKRPNQQSAQIYLVAGQSYYVEALHKQDGGTDHFAVAWQPPGGVRNVIGGSFLCALPGSGPVALEADEPTPLAIPSEP